MNIQQIVLNDLNKIFDEEINTFGKDGLDLRRFDYGVAIGLSVEYRHYVIGVEGRLGLCKLQKELQGKNITGFVTAGYKF